MLCENCGKNPATVHLTKILNGTKTELHLCEACAKDNEDIVSGEGDFSFNQLLSGLLNYNYVMNGYSLQNKEERCEKCGLTFSQFRKMGKFGCSECYNYFETQLDPIFRRIHGNSQHSGKVPLRSGTKIQLRKELNELKINLHQKILREEFEEAAKLRDEIKALELRLSKEEG